jgi:hypothetical protein
VSAPLDPLLGFRREFPILDTTTYLISKSAEPPPMRHRGDAFRFLLGTPAIPALYAARGFRSATPRDPRRRGGAAAADFDHALEVSRELNARGVLVDYRPGVGIRMSPHFYTGAAELDRVFAEIDAILSSGAWRRWLDRPAVVT